MPVDDGFVVRLPVSKLDSMLTIRMVAYGVGLQIRLSDLNWLL